MLTELKLWKAINRKFFTQKEIDMAIALVAGFLTAIGWWGGNKVTAAIDNTITPPAICTQQVQK